MSTSAAAHQPVFNGGGIGLTIVFEDDAAEAALVEDVEEFLGQAGTGAEAPVVVWAEGTAVEACGTVVSGGAVVDGGGQRQQQWRSSVGFREFGSTDGDDGACTAVGALGRCLPGGDASRTASPNFPSCDASWTVVRGRASPRGVEAAIMFFFFGCVEGKSYIIGRLLIVRFRRLDVSDRPDLTLWVVLY
jgi:hypothetical protein